jgi:hypothetical protein
MPPRYFTLAIIVSWLAMVGLFVYGDVWPRLAPSEPVLFPVDVVDEAGKQSETTNFEASKNGTSAYNVSIDWRYRSADDTFESEATLNRGLEADEAPRPVGPSWLPQIHSAGMLSSYRLTRAGETIGITSTTTYELVGLVDGKEVKREVEARVTGAPRAGQVATHLHLSFPNLTAEGKREEEKLGPFAQPIDRDAGAVAVSARGTVLNPLHPPRRFVDLEANQRWRVTVIDPFAVLGLVEPLDAAHGGVLRKAGVAADAGAFVLDAQVGRAVEPIEYQGSQVPCRVISCTGDGPVGPLTFWVRQSDGAVMRQDVTLNGDSWTLSRRPPGYSPRFSPKLRKLP